MSLPPPKLDLLVHSPSPEPLEQVLSNLLEPSPTLRTLASSLTDQFKSTRPSSYAQLLDQAQTIVNEWDWETKAAFVRSHPRIGETKGLSASSAAEQQNNQNVPGDILKRLLVRLDSSSDRPFHPIR